MNQIFSPLEHDISKIKQIYILSQLKFDNLKNISAYNKNLYFIDGQMLQFNQLEHVKQDLPFRSINQYLTGIKEKKNIAKGEAT